MPRSSSGSAKEPPAAPERANLYDEITTRIIGELEAGRLSEGLSDSTCVWDVCFGGAQAAPGMTGMGAKLPARCVVWINR